MTKNSPLIPMFRRIQTDIIESGLMDYLALKWQGKGIPGSGGSGSDLMILSVGQVVLIFIVMSCLFGVTAIVFILEVISKAIKVRLKRRRNRLRKKTRKLLMKKQDEYFIRYPDPNAMRKWQNKSINMITIE